MTKINPRDLQEVLLGQVFTTVSSAAKKAVLLETFPKLDAGKIGDSRSTSFEQLVMQAVRYSTPHPLLFPSAYPSYPRSLPHTHTVTE